MTPTATFPFTDLSSSYNHSISSAFFFSTKTFLILLLHFHHLGQRPAIDPKPSNFRCGAAGRTGAVQKSPQTDGREPPRRNLVRASSSTFAPDHEICELLLFSILPCPVQS